MISKSNKRAAHDTKFKCHFTRSILKSHNFSYRLKFQILVYCSSSRFVKNSGTWNAFTFRLVCTTVSCVENSFVHNKGTRSSQIRTKLHKTSILVAWINDGRPSFLLWLRLRLQVFEKEFEVAASVILQWISFELWNSVECMHRSPVDSFFLSFKYREMALCIKVFQLVIISVSFVTSAWNFIVRTLSSSCGAICFKIFSGCRDWHRPTSEVRSFTVSWSWAYFDHVYSQRQGWALVLVRLKLPETWKHLGSWDGYEFVVVRFLFIYVLLLTRIMILSRCWRKIAKNIRQNGQWK